MDSGDGASGELVGALINGSMDEDEVADGIRLADEQSDSDDRTSASSATTSGSKAGD